MPVPPKIGKAQKLVDVRAPAHAEQLAATREMVATSLEWVRLARTLATAGDGGVDPAFSYEQARQRSSSINPGREAASVGIAPEKADSRR